MHPDRSRAFSRVAACAVLLCAAGCADDDNGGAGASSGAGTGTGGQGGKVPAEPPPISAKATVKFKSKERLVNDFQKALALSDDELCREVGTHACDWVHGISLGGVDAYQAGIYEPLEASAITTPIAVDRIALSMCQTRAHLDLAQPSSAVIFKLAVSDGRIDPDHTDSTLAITSLFRRVHLREPKEREVELVAALYRDIEAGGSASPAADWATLSCYAVLTMLESVFY